MAPRTRQSKKKRAINGNSTPTPTPTPTTAPPPAKRTKTSVCNECPGGPDLSTCIHTTRGREFLSSRATLLAQAGVTPANTVSPSLSGSLASPGINSNLSPASPSINNAQSYPPGYMGYHAAYRGMPPPFHLPGPYPMGYSYPHPGPPVFPMWDPYSGPSSTSGPLQNHSSIDPFVTPVLPARIEPVATPNVPNLNHVPTPDPRDVIDPGLLSEPASHDQVSNNNFESPIPDQNSGADIEIDDKEDGEKNQDDSGDESESQTSPRSRVSATKPIYGHVEGAFRGAENAKIFRRKPLPGVSADVNRRFNKLMPDIIARCERLGAETGCWLVLAGSSRSQSSGVLHYTTPSLRQDALPQVLEILNTFKTTTAALKMSRRQEAYKLSQSVLDLEKKKEEAEADAEKVRLQLAATQTQLALQAELIDRLRSESIHLPASNSLISSNLTEPLGSESLNQLTTG